jgi:ribosomal protein L37AE/L43A
VLNDLGVGPTQVKKELQEWIGPVQRRHRRIGKGTSTGRTCSFCGCTDLGPLVAGPGVWICGKCALTAVEILRRTPRAQHRMSPRHRAS